MYAHNDLLGRLLCKNGRLVGVLSIFVSHPAQSLLFQRNDHYLSWLLNKRRLCEYRKPLDIINSNSVFTLLRWNQLAWSSSVTQNFNHRVLFSVIAWNLAPSCFLVGFPTVSAVWTSVEVHQNNSRHDCLLLLERDEIKNNSSIVATTNNGTPTLQTKLIELTTNSDKTPKSYFRFTYKWSLQVPVSKHLTGS